MIKVLKDFFNGRPYGLELHIGPLKITLEVQP